MKPDLFQACWRCLVNDSIEGKLKCVQQLVSARQLGQLVVNHDTEVLPLEKAGLPANIELVHPARVKRRRLGTQQGRVALLHAIAHIEFSAINLALDAVYRFRRMPEDYYDDWLRVAAEECYHFRLVRLQLQSMGSDYGQLPAHHGLWDVAVYSAADVMMRMALVPRVLDARGLDVTPSMIERVNRTGDYLFGEILGIILRDEVRHVRTGSQWFRYCCEQRKLDAVVTFDTILKQYMQDLNAHINGPLHVEARLQAGFTQTEIDNSSHADQ